MGTVTIAELLTQKDSSELLLITEPELSLRDRRSEWLCGGFLCDHPGSLDGRVRNDAADCADAAKCDADCNDQSNGELLAAALAHGERLHQASERTIQSPAWDTVAHRPCRSCEFEHTGGPKSDFSGGRHTALPFAPVGTTGSAVVLAGGGGGLGQSAALTMSAGVVGCPLQSRPVAH